MDIRRFSIDISPQLIEDLTARLRNTRLPTNAVVEILSSGASSVSWLSDFVSFWRDDFEWAAVQERLNCVPQVMVEIDGRMVHAVHLPGAGPDPMPLLLCHGWPSSFAEFLSLLPLLTDPAAHGGDPADAFSVVVPSLPGYLFSDPLPAGQCAKVTDTFVRLMQALGYDRFAVHGGDIGAFIGNRIALERPERVLGLHVTYPAEAARADDPAEREFAAGRAVGSEAGGAYAHMQRTKPLVLSYALSDSPVGLAAWILDKWQDWSDCDGDLRTRFGFEELATLVTLYWATDCIGTSFTFYRDWGLGLAATSPERLLRRYDGALPGVDPCPLDAGQQITVPAAVSLFELDYPLSFIERAYADLRNVVKMPRGGHFPALEEPDLLLSELQAFFRGLR